MMDLVLNGQLLETKVGALEMLLLQMMDGEVPRTPLLLMMAGVNPKLR